MDEESADLPNNSLLLSLTRALRPCPSYAAMHVNPQLQSLRCANDAPLSVSLSLSLFALCLLSWPGMPRW
jgi:hypothetical protein